MARLICALCGAVLVAFGCRGALETPRVPPEARPIALRLEHLRRLGRTMRVEGHAVRVVAIYARAPSYEPVASPERDGSEGVACVDDAARAAIVYLRDFERSGDARSRGEARALLDFVTVMERGDGEVVNFVHADGSLNTDAPTSRKSFSYWAARALWAFAEARRVLGEPRYDTVLDRLVARFDRALDGGLVAGSTTATSEALLGVLAALRTRPGDPVLSRVARRAAQALVARAGPSGAHRDLDGATGAAAWHAWGARSVEALARAGVALGRRDLIASARREADGLWAPMLERGEIAAEVRADGTVRRFPQIAYGISSVAGGLAALADATGDERYAALAGRAGAWLLGANAARVAMYDSSSGRTFDGIDAPDRVNRDAGAESTIEGLLALDAILDHPDGVDALLGLDGVRARARARARHAKIELTYWPAANPVEVSVAQELAARYERAHPSVHVHVQPIPAGRSSEEVLLAAIVAHATPDVCSNVTASLLARLVDAGALVRLDTIAPSAARLRERHTEAMLAPLRVRSGMYSIPWKTNPTMLLYNVGDLRAAHVAPPRTHSELVAAFRALARDGDGDGRLDHWAIAAPIKTTWHERFYDFYPLYLAASHGRTVVEGDRVVLDLDAAAAAMEVYRRGFAAQLLPRTNFEGQDPFIDGTVSLKLVGPWFIWELEQLKMPGLRYGVTPVPVPDGEDADAGYTFGDMKHIAVFSTTREPVEAARLAAFLTSPEADRMLVERSAQLPYRRALAGDARFHDAIARWPALDRFAERVERVRDLDVHRDAVEIFDAISEAHEAAAIYGVLPPREAAARIAREARRIVHAR